MGATYADGIDNTVRPMTFFYPNGRELTFNYGGAGSVSDRSSRIAVLVDDDDDTYLAEYSTWASAQWCRSTAPNEIGG